MISRLSELGSASQIHATSTVYLRCFIFRAPHQTFVSWNKCRVPPFHVNDRKASSEWKKTAWLLEVEFSIVVSG
jgi:hypothetical protein